MNNQISLLSQFLPYEINAKKNGSIQTGLKEYQTLLRAYLEAVRAWCLGSLEKFDALVGENACEIRAVWQVFLAGRDIEVTSQERISQVLSRSESLLESKTIATLMSSDASLQTILEMEELEISLTPEEVFLIHSYLLYEMKSVKTAEKHMTSLYRIVVADPKRYQRFGEVSTSFARGLLSRLRRSLATASVQFVRKAAFALQDPVLVTMASEAFTWEQNTLPCIPMFWTYKTLLLAAQQQGMPLILHAKFLEEVSDGYRVVDEQCLFFDSNNPYVATTPDLDRPACVVQGVVTAPKGGRLPSPAEWKASIERHSVIDVILAGAADHRQYPDASQDVRCDALQDAEYIAYKSLAKREGFSSENSTTFFIQHVYASRARSLFDKMTLCPRVNAAQSLLHLLLAPREESRQVLLNSKVNEIMR